MQWIDQSCTAGNLLFLLPLQNCFATHLRLQRLVVVTDACSGLPPFASPRRDMEGEGGELPEQAQTGIQEQWKHRAGPSRIIHPSSIPAYPVNAGLQEDWSLSQITLDASQGASWMSRQVVAGLTCRPRSRHTQIWSASPIGSWSSPFLTGVCKWSDLILRSVITNLHWLLRYRCRR